MGVDSNHKLILLGLDGADFVVVNKLMKKGYLPNLTKIAEEGVFTSLVSSFVPITPIAWTSMTTGKNPGKHGIFDWSVRGKMEYTFNLASSINCAAPRLWTMLNKHGYSTGIFNVPLTYPPENVNGYMISGFDTPSIEADFARPKGLKDAFLKAVPDYDLFAYEGFTKGGEQLYAKSLQKELKARRDAIHYLLGRYDTDFTMLVVMELDHLHHKLWHLLEQEDSLAVGIYQQADDLVGEVLARMGDSNLVIVSDHGGGKLEGVIYINKWLMDKGFLVVKRSFLLQLKFLLGKTDIIARIYKLITKMGLGSVKKFLPRELQNSLAASFISFKDIDWKKTRAFAFGEFGQIFINRKDEYPNGIVGPEEYGKTVSDIVNGLADIKDMSGNSVVENIYLGNDLYNGPLVNRGPDILFNLKDYAYDASVKFGFEVKNIFGLPEFEDSGTHRREGVFFARGPDIKRVNMIQALDIVDVTPTILSIYGCSLEGDFDGRVVSEILREKKIATRAELQGEAYSMDIDSPALSDKEQGEIKKKLQSLGYMD